jgi:hypothetical protein
VIGPGAACAFKRFGLRREAAMTSPRKGTIAVDWAFNFVLDSGVTAVTCTHWLKMWFVAL